MKPQSINRITRGLLIELATVIAFVLAVPVVCYVLVSKPEFRLNIPRVEIPRTP